uniref:Uncharacterized protein n=1 Tax=Anopheles farauti TaxID=69004 RepID=A0A182QYS4_9DIPT
MFSAKAVLFVGALMLFGLSGSVAQSSTENDAGPESTTASEVELTTERFNASRVLNAIRAEIERRREDRRQQTLQRSQERREQILRTLDELSERRREFELRRQEARLDAEALKEARRQEMEARRAGRLPQRERERVNRLRLEQLAEQTTPEENEIDDSGIEEPAGASEEASGVVQRVRNLLLIEEADGNLRLIDLDTEEGQQYVLGEGAKGGQEGKSE